MKQGARLVRYAGRSAFAALGITVSVAAMIILASLIHSVRIASSAGLAALGSHILIVTPSQQNALTLFSARPLTSADVDAVRSRVKEADIVAPISSLVGMVRTDRVRRVVTITGVIPGMEGLSGFEVREGRFIVERELQTAARVVVLSEQVTKDLGEPGVGDFVTLSGRPFRVVGTVSAQGQLLNASNNGDVVFIPATTAEAIYSAEVIRGGFLLRLREDTVVAAAADQVRNSMRASRRIGSGEPDDFTIRSQNEILGILETLETTAQMFLVCLVGISLLIAAIGVLNSVSTSVLERTPEIGLRRAIGATRSSIQGQFLLEALLIAAAGSAGGLIVGAALSVIFARVLNLPAAVDWQIAAGAVLSAVLFSAVAAMWPAVKAARLDPVVALHKE